MKRKIKIILETPDRAGLESDRRTLVSFVEKHSTLRALNDKYAQTIDECTREKARLETEGDPFDDRVVDQIARLAVRQRLLEARLPGVTSEESRSIGSFRIYVDQFTRSLSQALAPTYENLLAEISTEMAAAFPNPVQAREIAKQSPIAEAFCRRFTPNSIGIGLSSVRSAVDLLTVILADDIEIDVQAEERTRTETRSAVKASAAFDRAQDERIVRIAQLVEMTRAPREACRDALETTSGDIEAAATLIRRGLQQTTGN